MPVGGIIGGALGGLGSLLGQRSANKSAQQEAQRQQGIVDADQAKYQQYQNMLQGLIGTPGAPGQLGSNFFGPQTSTGTSSSFGHTDQTSMPVISQQYQALEGQLRKAIGDKLTRGASLPPGYAQSQIRATNESFAPQETALRNRAAQLGIPASQLLTGSPVEFQRAGALANQAAQLPLLERQMQNEDLAQAQGLTQAFGRGEHQVGSTSQYGNTSQTGPANIGGILSYLQMLAPKDRTIVQTPQGGSSLAAGLQGAFSGYNLGQGMFPQKQVGIAGGVPFDQIMRNIGAGTAGGGQ
jgi:hypothetical protein